MCCVTVPAGFSLVAAAREFPTLCVLTSDKFTVSTAIPRDDVKEKRFENRLPINMHISLLSSTTVCVNGAPKENRNHHHQ